MKMKEESGKAGLKLNIQKTKIMASGPITSWQIEGENMEAVTDFLFLGSKITADVTAAVKLKVTASLQEIYDKSRQCVKKQRHHFADKGPRSEGYGPFSSHVWIHSWTMKKTEHQKTDAFKLVLEKTLESSLESNIKPVNLKGNQP